MPATWVPWPLPSVLELSTKLAAKVARPPNCCSGSEKSAGYIQPGTSFECSLTYRVGSVDARVNHVGTGASARGVVVDVGGRPLGLVRDAAEAPGGASLRHIGVDAEDGLLLDILDLFVMVSKWAFRQMRLSVLCSPRAEPGAPPEGRPQPCRRTP